MSISSSIYSESVFISPVRPEIVPVNDVPTVVNTSDESIIILEC